jgi:UDP-N-acetylglucosamine--N-acetylmuramyl-(pentapeptide) pyrophosphoryl-undecaprenol N-acetylglucosamine transferase
MLASSFLKSDHYSAAGHGVGHNAQAVDQSMETSDVPTCVIFAGGGSGGHISPGLAIAERLAETSPRSKSIFICSNRSIDATMLTDAEADFIPIPASPPAIKPAAVLRFLLNLRASRTMVKHVIKRKHVQRVVALGGFVSVPVVLAARSMGVPVTLLNLDAPPGKANQWITRWCDDVYSAIDLPMARDFASKVVGMPIRRRALAPGSKQQCREKLNIDPNRKTLLITGASQGATSINTFIREFANEHRDLFLHQGEGGWQIVHLTGSGSDQQMREVYSAAGISALVMPFLNEIGLAWGAADLALSRAGANSVAEAAVNGVPSLFLPYPYHKDMHQKYNAQPLIDLGGALMVTDQIDAAANMESVAPVLLELMHDDGRTKAMRQALLSHQFPDAAMVMARMLLSDVAAAT